LRAAIAALAPHQPTIVALGLVRRLTRLD
jgi:hypothetical protein